MARSLWWISTTTIAGTFFPNIFYLAWCTLQIQMIQDISTRSNSPFNTWQELQAAEANQTANGADEDYRCGWYFFFLLWMSCIICDFSSSSTWYLNQIERFVVWCLLNLLGSDHFASRQDAWSLRCRTWPVKMDESLQSHPSLDRKSHFLVGEV